MNSQSLSFNMRIKSNRVLWGIFAILLANSFSNQILGTEPDDTRRRIWIPNLKVYFLPFDLESVFPITPESLSGLLLSTEGNPRTLNELGIYGCDRLVDMVTSKLTELPRKIVNPNRPPFECRALFVFTRADGFTIYLAMNLNGDFDWVNAQLELPNEEARELLKDCIPAGDLKFLRIKPDKKGK